MASEVFEKNISEWIVIYQIMPTATVMESYVNDSFNLIEAKPKTIFCDICNKFIEKTKKSQIHIPFNADRWKDKM